MGAVASGLSFAGAAGVSLATSSLVVARIEKVTERLGLSEAILGVVAALAGDAPEITAAVTAIRQHDGRVGAGVIIGSCVFNLAALLGLGAAAAGYIPLHRKVIALAGCVALWAALGSLGTVGLILSAPAALALVAGLLMVYVAVLALAHRGLRWMPVPARGRQWLVAAVVEEEHEMEEALRPVPGGWGDAVVAGAALVVVVLASVLMEHSAVSLGRQWGIPAIAIGALVLGGVTGIPNAVASTYLARRGRGAAALSTALNSNNLNIAVGLLVPAAVTGIGQRSGQTVFVASWCLALTVVTLVLAYLSAGLRRSTGIAILASYVAFGVAVVLIGSG